jgi:HD superfamily phosphohydrolase YqeK
LFIQILFFYKVFFNIMCPPSSLSYSASTTPSKPIDAANVIPETQISQSAYAHVSTLLAPSILNHSIRVYLYATALAKNTKSLYISNAAKHDLLFTACLFHDIGTTDTYDGAQRFEIEGADAAVKHLSQFDVSEQDKHDVWTAIAIHTSPQIAERIGELSKLVRLAVITDFGRRSEAWGVLEPLRAKLEEDFERCGIEKVLGDAVVEQAKKKPDKAPLVSWPGVMYKAHLVEPEWEGVNRAF